MLLTSRLTITLTSLAILTASTSPSELVLSTLASSATSRMQFQCTAMLLTSFLTVTLTSLAILTTLVAFSSLVSCVLLNAAENRYDGLIVLAEANHAIHVPLTNFSLEQSAGLQNTLQGFLCRARKGRPVPLDGVRWESFLSPLWRSRSYIPWLSQYVILSYLSLRLIRSSIPNRHLGTFLVFFGVRQGHSCFSLFIELVSVTPCIQSRGTKYSTLLFRHLHPLSVFSHRHPVPAHLVANFVSFLSVNHRRMAFPNFEV